MVLASFPNEVPYDLMRAPRNWVRHWLTCVGHKAALNTVGARRNTMHGGRGYDPSMQQELKKDLTEQQAKDWLMIQSGGLWTTHSLHNAGYLQHGTCMWCGIEDEDLAHLWWRCPHHEHRRASVRLALKQAWTTLPPCLSLHGIPVEPHANLEGPLWGNNSDADDTHANELQGDDRLAWHAVLHELCEALEIESGQESEDCAQLSIRQLAQKLLGNYQPLAQWAHPRFAEPATEAISTYTDGGLEQGNLAWLSSGTWGMYMDQPGNMTISPSFHNCAHVQLGGEQLRACGQSLGPGLSSARQEAMAIYAAMGTPRSHHFGVDNSAVVRRLQKLLRARGHHRRPWGLQDDGDIWQCIAQCIRQQRVEAYKITKVTGHATDLDVAQGKVTQRDKHGNDSADKEAERARTMQRVAQRTVLQLLAAKWKKGSGGHQSCSNHDAGDHRGYAQTEGSYHWAGKHNMWTPTSFG